MTTEALLARIEALEQRLAALEPKTFICAACSQQGRHTGRAGGTCPHCGSHAWQPVLRPTRCTCGKPWWGLVPPVCPVHGAAMPLVITCVSSTP